MADVYEIVVTVEEKETNSGDDEWSPVPSTSESSSPTSDSNSPRSTQSARRINKKRSGYSQFLGEKRRMRKFPASRMRYAKKLASASKLRLWKNKIDKEHKKRLAEQMANIERLQRERELLVSGQSEIAIMCETLTENARSLRVSYERQQAALYRALISSASQFQEPYSGHIFF